MIIGDIETTEKVEYEDLLKNYYEKMEIIEEQDKEIERLKEENNFLKQLIPNEKKYSYGIRVGSDGSETRNEEDNK